MQPIDFVESWYYGTVYYIFFLLVSWGTVLYYIGSGEQKMLRSNGNAMQGMALLLTIVIILYLGLRPNGSIFVDSNQYRYGYAVLPLYDDYVSVNMGSEWLWHNFNHFLKEIGLNEFEFTLVVEFVYFGGMFTAVLLLMRKNLWMAMMFFFTAMSTYAYGVNGIRNGMACSIELVAVSLLAIDRKYLLGALVLMFLALGIHRSTMLPSAAALMSAFVVREPKMAIRFWLLSIAVSLAAGPVVEQFFSSLGFDDRMSKYSAGAQDEATMSEFSKTGFRWDFLFYSIWPVVMTWYLTVFRKFRDRTFDVIANTYLLCNAFWIMVIRASFSNRFAYLSWFLYPLVIAYPMFRMNLWKDQDRKTAIIFFFYSGFIFFMFFIYYFGTMSGFRGFNLYWWRQ